MSNEDNVQSDNVRSGSGPSNRGNQPDNGQRPRIRTSDAEREHVAEALRNGVTEGRLTLEEGDERLAALYRTKYRDELPPLLADLPAAGGWTGPAGDTAGTAGGPASGGGPGPSSSGGPSGPGGLFGSRGPFGPGGPFGQGGPFGASGLFGQGSPFGQGGVGAGWGAAFDPRMWRRRRILRGARFAVIAALLITFFAVTGHFFWPIFPILFIGAFIRLALFSHRWHHWHRGYGPGSYPEHGPSGYGQSGYGPSGYGPSGYGPSGYGPSGYEQGMYGSSGWSGPANPSSRDQSGPAA